MRAHWVAGTGRITAFALTRGGAGRDVGGWLGAVPPVGVVAAPPLVPDAVDAVASAGDDVPDAAAAEVVGLPRSAGAGGGVAQAESASAAATATSGTRVSAREARCGRRTEGSLTPTRLACSECLPERAGWHRV
jgi:hypothetical protein